MSKEQKEYLSDNNNEDSFEEQHDDNELENPNIQTEIKKYPLLQKNSDYRLYHSVQTANKLFIDATKYKIQQSNYSSFGYRFDVTNKRTNHRQSLIYVKDSWISKIKSLLNIKILKFLDHENIIRIYDVSIPQFPHNIGEFYFVIENMETDLKSIIRSQQPLTDEHLQFFMYQIIHALHYAHSAKIIYRNLSPNDLLINSDCTIKLFNFSESNSLDNLQIDTTDGISLKHYKAPEQLMEQGATNKSDIWAAGCIFAELLKRRVLFDGNSLIKVIEQIISFCGKPSSEDIQFMINKTQALDYIEKLETKQINLEEYFPNATPVGLDLLRKMLTFNPEKRLDALQCLQHKYLEDLFEPTDEKVSDKEFDWQPFIDVINNNKLVDQEMYKESLQYKYL